MQHRVWSLKERAQILLATNEANANADFILSSGKLSDGDQVMMEAYRERFRAALGSIALAIGVPPASLVGPRRRDDVDPSARAREVRFLPRT